MLNLLSCQVESRCCASCVNDRSGVAVGIVSSQRVFCKLALADNVTSGGISVLRRLVVRGVGSTCILLEITGDGAISTVRRSLRRKLRRESSVVLTVVLSLVSSFVLRLCVCAVVGFELIPAVVGPPPVAVATTSRGGISTSFVLLVSSRRSCCGSRLGILLSSRGVERLASALGAGFTDLLADHRQATADAGSSVVAHVEAGGRRHLVVRGGRSRSVGVDGGGGSNREVVGATSRVAVSDGAFGHRAGTDVHAGARTLDAALQKSGELSFGRSADGACGQNR